MSTFTPFEEKMESAGISTAAIKAFSRCYEALVSNHSGMIPETDIQPADGETIQPVTDEPNE